MSHLSALSTKQRLNSPWLRLVVWGAAGLALAAVLWLAGAEFLATVPGSRPLAGKLTSRWALTVVELGLFCLLLLAGLALAGLWAAAQRSPRAAAWLGALAAVRARWPWLGWLAVLFLALFPAFLLLNTYWGALFTGPYLRVLLLLACGLLAAAAVPLAGGTAGLLDARRLAFGWLFVMGVYALAAQLMTVNNHPFSLTWSEGNRLYEYSIYFAAKRYHATGELTGYRQSIGRFLLWGLPFLSAEAPIWVHRLWNALLSTLPHLALGYVLARWSGLSRPGRWTFALWVLLFLGQGPIYTPLILSALLVALALPGLHPGSRWSHWLLAAAAAVAAGYYASLSRWTWLPAVPVWAVFILLAERRRNADDVSLPAQPWYAARNLLELAPAALVALAGLAGGMLANPKLLMPQKLSQSTALAQPLLWYRLFPNPTYPEGVLGALLMAAVPLGLLLAWQALSRRWKLDGWQALAYTAGCLAVLGGGLVASVKIGGGNNLHNLDMFLVSLVFLAGLALRGKSEAALGGWPFLARSLLVVALLLPAWTTIRTSGVLNLPTAESTRKALEVIRSQAAAAQQTGQVLFIDQRQLLTFGYVRGVDLVPEYEKKYMMDQAMASDAEYFAGFYRDLAAQRFSLIVSDMQFTLLKDGTYAFGEENNAWVNWVAKPLLCYYTPLRTMQNVDIQLLVPNPNPVGCAP